MTFTLCCALALMAVSNPPRIDFYWNTPQSQFLLTRAQVGGPIEYIDLEGAIRAGKSTPAVSKLAEYAVTYPGIHMGAARWSQDALDAQVKPLWRDMAGKQGLTLQWHADEEYDEVQPFGSRVYLRALKASEETNRYGKLAGLTLSVLWVDQPEEVPHDVYKAYIPGRLSQPGFPHEAWLTPNPPGEGHWLAIEFPEDNSLAHHTYIRTTVYDNRHNLGDAYIADLERAYPVGTVLRRRFIDGKRGLSVQGKPVYGGYFDRERHAQIVDMNGQLPLYEAWDYGFHRPCVVWSQFTPWGGFHVLGGVMGEDIYLEDFAPLALQQRTEWFPDPMTIEACADPAGSHRNSQGVNRSGLDTLFECLGYKPRVVLNSNAPEMRDYAIQTAAGYMRRRALRGGEAFQVHPTRWRVISQRDAKSTPFAVDGLEAGYVWDNRVVRTSRGKSIQVPLKDKYYEHAMNNLEYLVLNFGPAMPARQDERTLEKQLLKMAQKDDEDVERSGGRFAGRFRGGR
jgi:hypothetical protein